jgi:hypothetical protein
MRISFSILAAVMLHFCAVVGVCIDVHGSPKSEELFLTHNIADSNSTASCALDINIVCNDMPDTAWVKPNELLQFFGELHISNTSCTNCRQQLLIGIEQQAVACLFDGIPLVCPQKSTQVIDLQCAAPSDPGIYKVYVHQMQKQQMDINAYLGPMAKNAKLVATIIVMDEE